MNQKKNDPSELFKIAFGLSELLDKQFPHLKFQVLPSMLVTDLDKTSPWSNAEDATIHGVGVISDKYQIVVTEERISLTIASDEAIEQSGQLEALDVGIEFITSVDKSTERHTFELPDPTAIDKVLEIIRKQM